ncbi:MAG: zinc ribbon domain-containing protein [Desulfarculaceae bacterium]|nr:zinc ribbon domain-containing protein [Desulfarculaceae bacterium]MCF8073726.1 zinc ribbon domain-containing protein [Desulfarculaceae bacterium]MCF8101967.1 zinc ribbon domain-containing protein [Desulfarculaceae bacterium]MCF8115937.1 zinc ribbon domain-containing protein [Desulfarculaceae bacterium]
MAKNKPEKDLRFERFGTKGFTATTKVNDFIDRLEAGQVCGTKCPGCGQRFFPPRADCPDCSGAGPMEWFQVEGEGKLATYSVLRYAPQGFEQDLPYAIAVADYGDYKLFGRLSHFGPEIEPGCPVTTRAVSLPDGRVAYEFVPQGQQ